MIYNKKFNTLAEEVQDLKDRFDKATGAVKGDKGDPGEAPYIGANNHWFVYDASVKEWIDTGVNANGIPGPEGDKGDKGDKGDTGATGAQGNEGLNIFICADNSGEYVETVPLSSIASIYGRTVKIGDLLLYDDADQTNHNYIHRIYNIVSDTVYISYITDIHGEQGDPGQPGTSGTNGTDGVSIYMCSYNASPSLTTIPDQYITVPSGQTLKIGDLLLYDGANNSYIHQITAIHSGYVVVTYVQNIKGAKGDPGDPAAITEPIPRVYSKYIGDVVIQSDNFATISLDWLPDFNLTNNIDDLYLIDELEIYFYYNDDVENSHTFFIGGQYDWSYYSEIEYTGTYDLFGADRLVIAPADLPVSAFYSLKLLLWSGNYQIVQSDPQSYRKYRYTAKTRNLLKINGSVTYNELVNNIYPESNFYYNYIGNYKIRIQGTAGLTFNNVYIRANMIGQYPENAN